MSEVSDANAAARAARDEMDADPFNAAKAEKYRDAAVRALEATYRARGADPREGRRMGEQVANDNIGSARKRRREKDNGKGHGAWWS